MFVNVPNDPSNGLVLTDDVGRSGTQRLACELTVRAGKVVYDLNGISRPEWTTLPKDYRQTGDPRWDSFRAGRGLEANAGEHGAASGARRERAKVRPAALALGCRTASSVIRGAVLLFVRDPAAPSLSRGSALAQATATNSGVPRKGTGVDQDGQKDLRG